MNKKVISVLLILSVLILEGCETSRWRWKWPREETPTKELTNPVHRAVQKSDDWVKKNVW